MSVHSRRVISRTRLAAPALRVGASDLGSSGFVVGAKD
jgi:hypothetical protein